MASLVTLQTRLTTLEESYLKAAKAAAYGIGNRQKTNQQLEKLSNEIDKVEKKIARLTRGGIVVRGITTN